MGSWESRVGIVEYGIWTSDMYSCIVGFHTRAEHSLLRGLKHSASQVSHSPLPTPHSPLIGLWPSLARNLSQRKSRSITSWRTSCAKRLCRGCSQPALV